MLRLSSGFNVSFPYNKIWHKCVLSSSVFNWLIMGLIVSNINSLKLVNKGQMSRKCTVDSGPLPQIQASLGVSLKLCLCLWAFSELRPVLNWYKYLRSGLCKLKILFLSGLMILTNVFLNKLRVSVFRISGPILFQQSIASGKNFSHSKSRQL